MQEKIVSIVVGGRIKIRVMNHELTYPYYDGADDEGRVRELLEAFI